MPTMPQEQIDEMEHAMQDLLDQLEDALKWKPMYEAVKQENARLRLDRSLRD